MNYKALAEHLANRCRRAFDGVTTERDVVESGQFVVNRPYKTEHDGEEPYTFDVMQMRWHKRKQMTSTMWRCQVFVFQNLEIAIDHAGYKVPKNVLDCLESGAR